MFIPETTLPTPVETTVVEEFQSGAFCQRADAYPFAAKFSL